MRNFWNVVSSQATWMDVVWILTFSETTTKFTFGNFFSTCTFTTTSTRWILFYFVNCFALTFGSKTRIVCIWNCHTWTVFDIAVAINWCTLCTFVWWKSSQLTHRGWRIPLKWIKSTGVRSDELANLFFLFVIERIPPTYLAEGDRRSSEGRVGLGIYPMTIIEDDDNRRSH